VSVYVPGATWAFGTMLFGLIIAVVTRFAAVK
jgi:hypothetical protein